MEDARFDDLTRELAVSRSRRSLVKSAFGAMFGGTLAVAGVHGASAAARGRAPAEICRKDGDCASGLCGPVDRMGRRRCLCAGADQCPQPADQELAAVCSPDGICGVERQGGCFIAGTPIAIPGGATRGVHLFMVGDEVLSVNGSSNRVIEVERHLLGRRPVYSINDSSAFFTPEHPFMSDGCWRAIDVEMARQADPTIRIEPLRVGDTVYAMAAVPALVTAGAGFSSAPVIAEPIRIDSLLGRWLDPETEIVNLLLDGDMTYISNGFVVHD
jgi:hypothetical protein